MPSAVDLLQELLILLEYDRGLNISKTEVPATYVKTGSRVENKMNALIKRKARTWETLHYEKSFSCTRQSTQERDHQFPPVLEETMVRIYIILDPKVS